MKIDEINEEIFNFIPFIVLNCTFIIDMNISLKLWIDYELEYIMHLLPRQNFKKRFLHGILNIILKLMQVHEHLYLCKLFPNSMILFGNGSEGINRTMSKILISLFSYLVFAYIMKQ